MHLRWKMTCHNTPRCSRLLARCGLVLVCVLSSGLAAAQSANPEGVAQAAGGLPTTRVVEGDILRWYTPGRRSLAMRSSLATWHDGIVPYRISPALSATSVQAIHAAIDHWNQVSAISLIPVADILNADPSLSAVHLDSVLFNVGEGCASWVGRRGGEQEVWVAPSCTVGSLMHEIGHVLGLEHEHTRPDRDQYITIHWDNILAEKRHNFDVAPATSVIHGAYDYGSIMHYGPYNFAMGGRKTISPIYGPASAIGQRSGPSTGDLAAIAAMYATDLSVNTQYYELEEGAEVSVTVSNDQGQGAHDISVDVAADFSQLLAHSDNGWNCRAQSAGHITCYLNRLAATSRSVLILRFRDALDTQQVSATVRSKTPDTRLQNNSDQSAALPMLAAAQIQDDAQLPTFGGAASALWLLLGLLRLQRQPRGRVYR